MSELRNPSEIAREALRRLAAQRIPPTPENYREHYERIETASRQEHQADPDAAAIPALPAGEPPGAPREAAAKWRELLAQTLEFAVVSLARAPGLAEEAGALAQATREATGEGQVEALAAALQQFWFKLEVRSGEDLELHQGLLRLLRLLIDNTRELLNGDAWLSGQMAVLTNIVGRPLDLASIQEAEHRLKQVIAKQSALGASLQEAKTALKHMVTAFIDRLGELSQRTNGYHGRLEEYAQRIRQTEDIAHLGVLIGELLKDTRDEQLAAARTRDELLAARRRVETAEAKVRELESTLEHVSELVHEDELTGVLNRRGLDEAYQREMARADRNSKSLCVSLLDIDNFKRVNDIHGHQVGDDALQHLVRVVKRTMRPTDVLARYGGEEFLLLLPETELEEAVSVVVRLQRTLTKAFFLHNNERVLITFSAGVALRKRGELPYATIERADKALYQAKRAGKNRVLPA